MELLYVCSYVSLLLTTSVEGPCLLEHNCISLLSETELKIKYRGYCNSVLGSEVSVPVPKYLSYHLDHNRALSKPISYFPHGSTNSCESGNSI